MRKFLTFALCLLLTGCGGPNYQMPTMRQVKLNLPSALLECPNLPRSPGAAATERQTAVYLLALYSVANRCRQNNGAVNRLYQRYRGEIQKLSGVVRRAANVAEYRKWGKGQTHLAARRGGTRVLARAPSRPRYAAQRHRKVAAAW